MSRFTTRVELHKANWDDYQNLHAQMESRGFTRTVKADSGVTYHLPWAEYNYEGPATVDDVFGRAKLAVHAAVPNLKREILVTEAKARKWDGLQPVTVGRAA